MKVRYWTKELTKLIETVSSEPDELYASFIARCREHFIDELDGAFTLYQLPYNYKLLEERTKVTNNEQLAQVLQRMDSTDAPPLLFIFDRTIEPSPGKLPEKVTKRAGSAGSVVSRDTEASTRCREVADSTCAFCGFKSKARSAVQAAHLFEYQDYRDLPVEKRTDALLKKGLGSIHDARNLLCLCATCHSAFDGPHYDIGIVPKSLTIAVGQRVALNQCNDQSDATLGDLAGRAVTFSGPKEWRPPQKLLTYRFRFYSDSQAALHQSQKTTVLKAASGASEVGKSKGKGKT